MSIATRSTGDEDSGDQLVVRLDNRPEPFRDWFGGLWRYRGVLVALAQKDFRSQYKRASFGILWAVGVPLFQAIVMAFVFSRVALIGSDDFSYAGFVLAGMMPWFYMATVTVSATTSIVDAASLTDKVWFPRAIVALVPVASNLVTLAVSALVVVVALPILGEPLTLRLLLIVPAALLLIGFATALGLVLSALYVYFRDVRFMVQAAMLMWFYLTPIVYLPSRLESVGPWLDFNPMTAIVGLFQKAAVDAPVPTGRAILVSVATTLVLMVVGVVAHRRHDRLFVDLL